MLKFKEGVQLTITKPINKLLDAVTLACTEFGVDAVVTSGTDGKHGKQSKHYTAEAIDLRIFHLEVDRHQPLVKRLKEILGKDFDIVLESDHVHLEFDPKGVKPNG